jgi:large subunit ribosomal protein L23
MNLIKRPVITEKTIKNYKELKKVTFEVSMEANKTNASKAIEEIYGVKVLDVTVANRLGKYKFSRLTRKLNKNKDRKIMVFKLSEKDEIDIFNS